MTKAQDLLDHMRRIGTWVDWDHTVDRVIVRCFRRELLLKAPQVPRCDRLASRISVTDFRLRENEC